ncbi:glycosyltransferase [Vogesella mureinivorans]|uniref:glycosyltransferase n=1 Tax=Vogesella mureinivorans TaxID=657276 RepID=UPI0011CC9A4B|nr:glycosyltransferase [Vogesella mureinivorans]
MKKLIIVNVNQFGFHTDSYYLAKISSGKWNVTYICWDYGFPRVDSGKVNVLYLSRDGGVFKRLFSFLCNVHIQIKEQRPDLVFVKYFMFCSLISKNFGSKTIVDYRTVSVDANPLRRFIQDAVAKIEAKFFKKRSAISNAVKVNYALGSGCLILPLGANKVAPHLGSNFFDILYVGTLSGRKIEDTIVGFSSFLANKSAEVKKKIRYLIVGDGWAGEVDYLKSLVEKYNLSDNVHVLGRKSHEEVQDYLRTAALGVSYVPMTRFFDLQPPTKTYEYLLAGLPVIATKTTANLDVMDDAYGVTITDNPEEFSLALGKIFENHVHYINNVRTADFDCYTWENIVNRFMREVEYE